MTKTEEVRDRVEIDGDPHNMERDVGLRDPMTGISGHIVDELSEYEELNSPEDPDWWIWICDELDERYKLYIDDGWNGNDNGEYGAYESVEDAIQAFISYVADQEPEKENRKEERPIDQPLVWFIRQAIDQIPAESPPTPTDVQELLREMFCLKISLSKITYLMETEL